MALQAFRRTYYGAWIVERHDYRTPAEVRANQTAQLAMAA